MALLAIIVSKRRLLKASSLVVGFFAVAIGTSPLESRQLAAPFDPVETWNEIALQTVRDTNRSDAQAARLYAMVNVAMYDAVNGIVSKHGMNDAREQALVLGADAPPQANIYAAAAAAAHAVLTGEFPSRAALYDAQLQSDLGTIGAQGPGSAGQQWGAAVGAAVRAARATDGSSPNETQPPGAGPGRFRAAWSGVQFRNLAPFGIANSSIYFGNALPALESLDYASAFAEEKLAGSAAIPDADKLDTFRFWGLGGGTSQPPGAWIQVALIVTDDQPLPLPEKVRLLALVSMAMADAVAPTVWTKWFHRHWRPGTAIREADTDGNPYTDADPGWNPRSSASSTNIGTSPEYWSGHSSFSGAGAAALAGFFCNDSIPFSLVTDSAPGGLTREYPGFAAAADEAGDSRVVGGIHFEFSNLQGLAAGRAIAAEILASKLRRLKGPTHFGSCPL